jgi:pSer/pThr/pTyr-binding forkhead associated (FHA) protein
MASLIVTHGTGVGRYFPLGRRTSVVGRDEAVLIQLPDPHVSRKHFQILFKEQTGLYYILDMRSRHGTFVNGCRILDCREHPLSNNDVIEAGGTTALFTTEDFSDREGALAYQKKVGEREERTLTH